MNDSGERQTPTLSERQEESDAYLLRWIVIRLRERSGWTNTDPFSDRIPAILEQIAKRSPIAAMALRKLRFGSSLTTRQIRRNVKIMSQISEAISIERPRTTMLELYVLAGSESRNPGRSTFCDNSRLTLLWRRMCHIAQKLDGRKQNDVARFESIEGILAVKSRNEFLQRDAESVLDELETLLARSSPTSPATGISLFRAALAAKKFDKQKAERAKKEWRNSRSPKLPDPIGKSSSHSQTDMYCPKQLAKFVAAIEAEEASNLLGMFKFVLEPVFPRTVCKVRSQKAS